MTDRYARKALDHVRHLAERIGGRGSCTRGERRAAEYAAAEMLALGVDGVRLESYRGAPSTYRPYTLAFLAAIAGTLVVWLVGGRWAMAAAAALSALGAWAMLAETDFSAHWARLVLPKASSQNAVGVIRPSGPVRRQAVLCAHLDTHRTPVFYSSKTWNLLFSLLVGVSFLSMVVAGAGYVVGAIAPWEGARWIGLAALPMQAFALSLCLHADLTPFSPGANDNASGVGTILALAQRLQSEPLRQTEVWLAFTGCEEASSYGIAAFLDAHGGELGSEAVYVILDQVGVGRVMYLTADGLILKRRTHPRALDLARRASAALLDLGIGEHVGIAYTDAAVATKRGLIALTIDALPAPGAATEMHWHRMSDTPDRIDLQTLADAHAFAWQVLKQIDGT